MKKTYQPFIIEKADEILEILKEDVVVCDHAKNRLCMLLTQKFIDGKLSSEDDVSSIFDSEAELLVFINECYVHENLMSLMEKGLVGMLDDDNEEDTYFLTEKGKLYMKEVHNSGIMPVVDFRSSEKE